MELKRTADEYSDIYELITKLDPDTVTESELDRLAKQLQIDNLTGTPEEIMDKLGEKAFQKYLYHWSLKLDPHSDHIAEDLQMITTVLNIQYLTGDVDYIIDVLKEYTRELIEFQTSDGVPLAFISVSELQDSNALMFEATRAGRESLVYLAIDQGATNFNKSLEKASEKGHVNIVTLLLQKGADNLDDSMIYAAIHGHKDIIQLLINKGSTKLDEPMAWAAKAGHADIINLLVYNGATDFDFAIRMATMENRQNIVNMLRNMKDSTIESQ